MSVVFIFLYNIHRIKWFISWIRLATKILRFSGFFFINFNFNTTFNWTTHAQNCMPVCMYILINTVLKLVYAFLGSTCGEVSCKPSNNSFHIWNSCICLNKNIWILVCMCMLYQGMYGTRMLYNIYFSNKFIYYCLLLLRWIF